MKCRTHRKNTGTGAVPVATAYIFTANQIAIFAVAHGLMVIISTLKYLSSL